MKRMTVVGLAVVLMSAAAAFAALAGTDPKSGLEPFTYKEDFETNELNAWASYPLWQDTAFDPNIRPNTIVPGDPNISLVERVTPYTHVDNYAGAQKLLDMVFLEDSLIRLRAYLKSELKPEFLKVRLAAGPEGAVDVTIAAPPTNTWYTATVRYQDIVRENPRLKGQPVKVNALAVLAKFPKADPAMAIYFGLDDVVFEGARPAEFQFAEPKMHKLSEWKPYIPDSHYRKGDTLAVKGRWPVAADRVELVLGDFTKMSKASARGALRSRAGEWSGSVKLALPEGLYLGTLTAYAGKEKLAATEFTVFIDPPALAGVHPRLRFSAATVSALKARLGEERFRKVREDLLKRAQDIRASDPVDKLVFDVDNFPEDEPTIGNVPRSLPGWSGVRVRAWRNALNANALAYALLGDEEAGRYAKDYLVKFCGFPFWVHPWWEKRGQHTYYPVGETTMEVALAYDVVYHLMSEAERQIARDGMFRNMIVPAQKGYVEDNLVTNNTSNWVAHITGGSLMAQAAIYGDGPGGPPAEPYLTGTLFKFFDLIQRSIGRDGGYGESAGYCYFTMQSLSKTLPSLENVFKLDLSGNIHLSYTDMFWAGLIKSKYFFYFGDSGSSGAMRPMTSWTWFLEKSRDPQLAWLFNHLKDGETLNDVFHNVDGIPAKDPFSENPVRCFKDLGTTVFKSGWEDDDFIFVLRTGPFYNHQHLDQGTFWLADRGSRFIEERHGSSYYDCPFYQSHYTQPVGHSTILVDHNEQSQRVGDPLRFAEGFEDYAYVADFLDGTEAAFVSGDIGRLYWGKVKEMRRNALYLKPRTVLLLDTVVPAETDVDVTALFHGGYLKDILADPKASTVTKGKATLTVRHLSPEMMAVKAEKTPIYVNTYREYPLQAEGMLTATARTAGKPLVIANLLSTDTGSLKTAAGAGHVAGSQAGKDFAFTTSPGAVYRAGAIETDALAVTWTADTTFAALCTTLSRDGALLVRSAEPITCERAKGGLKFSLSKPAAVTIGLTAAPGKVLVNGAPAKGAKYDKSAKTLTVTLPTGEGLVAF